MISSRPVAGADRIWGSAGVVTSVGPLRIPPRADLVDALRLLADHAELTRIGRMIDGDFRRWRTTTDLDAYCEASVQMLAETAGEQVGQTARRILDLGRGGRPISIVTCGDSISLNVAHVLGDGFYMARLLAAVVETARTGVVPEWVTRPVLRHPLRRALWSYFGLHPGRVPAVFRAAGRPRAGAAPIEATRPWQPSVACVFRVSSTEAFGELKRWRKTHASGISTIPITIAAGELARTRLGRAAGPPPLVLFDARRYAPRAAGEVAGNFCAGLRMEFTDAFDPQSVHRGMLDAVELGRPLTALSAGVMLTRGRRPPAGAVSAPDVADVGWDLAYTHMGRPPDIVRLPWIDDGRLPYYAGALTPAGPTAMTLAFSEIGNRINVSASFHDNVIDAADVEELLDLLCADPVALLESHRRRELSVAR